MFCNKNGVFFIFFTVFFGAFCGNRRQKSMEEAGHTGCFFPAGHMDWMRTARCTGAQISMAR